MMASEPFSSSCISVWWSYGDCIAPTVCKPEFISGNVTHALRNMNFYGPVAINAFLNMQRAPHSTRGNIYTLSMLSCTNITIHDIYTDPRIGSDVAEKVVTRRMLSAMKLWAQANPALATIMVIISNAQYLTPDICKLAQEKYHILMAYPNERTYDLPFTPQCEWLIESLACGEPPYKIKFAHKLTLPTTSDGGDESK